MKQTLKKILYTVRPYSLPEVFNFKIGYNFHTEMVYDDAIYAKLLSFCGQYLQITGKQAICTLMTGNSPKVAAGMKAFKCPDQKLSDRYHELSTVATLGYHGHFYLNPLHWQRYETEIRSNNFSKANLKEQFDNDLGWLKNYGINHNGLYAGGWWFMNQHLLALLIDAGFKFDFSFSKSVYFRNQFSHQLMVRNYIKTGQNFEIQIPGKGKIVEIQNLIGAPSSPLFPDYTRNLLKILDKEQTNVTGVVNSHDYDLNQANTLKLFERFSKMKQISFFDAEDLLTNSFNANNKVVQIPATAFKGPAMNY